MMKVAEFGAGIEVAVDSRGDFAIIARYGDPVRTFEGEDAERVARREAEFMGFEYRFSKD